MAVLPCRHVSVSIDRDPATVYAYVVDPRNLPRWAPGLARSVRQDGGGWTVETVDGPVAIAFSADNDLGVADHRVSGPGGIDTLNPMRVIPNGDGAEVVFSLFRQPGTTAAEFERDAGLVAADLHLLQRLLGDGDDPRK